MSELRPKAQAGAGKWGKGTEFQGDRACKAEKQGRTRDNRKVTVPVRSSLAVTLSCWWTGSLPRFLWGAMRGREVTNSTCTSITSPTKADANRTQPTGSVFNTDLGSQEITSDFNAYTCLWFLEAYGRKIKKDQIQNDSIGIKFHGRHEVEITNSRG